MATLCAFRSSSKNLSVFKLNMAADKIEIDRQGMHCFFLSRSRKRLHHTLAFSTVIFLFQLN